MKPKYWKVFAIIAFLLVIQRTLSLTIRCNLTKNIDKVAVPQDTKRKVFCVMQLMQTKDE